MERYWRDVGLGYKVPKEAKEGNYVDKKCPFTGNVSIRGAVLKGMCISTKMKRTIIIRRNYLHYIKCFACEKRPLGPFKEAFRALERRREVTFGGRFGAEEVQPL